MQITVPIFVRRTKDSGGALNHRCELLFAPQLGIYSEGVDLGKVIRRLTDVVRKLLMVEAQAADQTRISSLDYSEPIDAQAVTLQLSLSDRTLRAKLLLVKIARHGTIQVFSPQLPDLWFDLKPDESLAARACEVYEAHFNQCIKDKTTNDLLIAANAEAVWADSITLAVETRVVPKPDENPLLAFLGGNRVGGGANELVQVGRCLDWLDLESLADPIGLDHAIESIIERWSISDRRGVVLVGPPGSGKSAAIEGAVRRRRLQEGGTERKRGHVWQLSPPRLISGMSYLGQWQSRLLAIWEHAHRRDLVLYFDDFLGLYHAGVTRDSQSCAADLIRAQLETSPVRLLTEMTPQAWAIFRERDRALAQQYIVLPLDAKSRDDSLDVLLGIVSRLESMHHCRFDVDVIPEVLGLYDRFERTSVLPGKAISALTRLALTQTGAEITRETAQKEFEARTGLSQFVIDNQKELTRAQIVTEIGETVFGQLEPINRIADRILAAVARINDVSRPLGVFLLLGPTGVGKTELAKTVAKYLFGDDGLIRIDMNELATADAVARLVGTFAAPDGILTVAARRRPHAVLLLDEIEKANPAVLDTLLQVIGEARLTDARGRTVDLSGMMILMTSNLGASHSQRDTVLSDVQSSRRDVYRRAAKAYFRPEFFNRIDALLDFDSLDPAVILDVARRQIDQVLSRDGLARHLMVVQIEPSALQSVAGRGFDARLGARAVKRQIERDLVTPISRLLVESGLDDLLIVRAIEHEGSISLDVNAITMDANLTSTLMRAHLTAQAPPAELVIEHANQVVARIEQQLPRRPMSFSTSGGRIDAALLDELTLQDQLESVREAVGWLEQLMVSQGRHSIAITTPAGRMSHRLSSGSAHRLMVRDMQAANDINRFIREMTESVPITEKQAAALNVRRQLHRLAMLMFGKAITPPCRLVVNSFGDHDDGIPEDYYMSLDSWSLKSLISSAAASLIAEGQAEKSSFGPLTDDLLLEDSFAIGMAATMCGGWLRISSDRRVTYADVSLAPVNVAPTSTLPSEPSTKNDRQSFAAVRWIVMDEQGIDLQTGNVVHENILLEMLRRLVADAIPSLPHVPLDL